MGMPQIQRGSTQTPPPSQKKTRKWPQERVFGAAGALHSLLDLRGDHAVES